MRSYIIGTRGSDLALWQAHFLQTELKAVGIEATLVIIKTKGDKIQDLSFDKIEGKGFFTKEIEDALLESKVDIAVHSMKDLPTTNPDGLVIGAVSHRADPRDVLLIRKESVVKANDLGLKDKAIVGTSSARRKAQIKNLVNSVIIKDIRGNVLTRVNKLRSGDFDAILLAKAGLDRLKLDVSDLEVVALHPKEFVPAPAQGVLAFQCRADDIEVRKILIKLHKSEVAECTNVERKVLNMMDGGCHLPLGIHVFKDANMNFHAHAAYATSEDEPLRQFSYSQSTHHNLAQIVYDNLTKK